MGRRRPVVDEALRRAGGELELLGVEASEGIDALEDGASAVAGGGLVGAAELDRCVGHDVEGGAASAVGEDREVASRVGFDVAAGGGRGNSEGHRGDGWLAGLEAEYYGDDGDLRVVLVGGAHERVGDRLDDAGPGVEGGGHRARVGALRRLREFIGVGRDCLGWREYPRDEGMGVVGREAVAGMGDDVTRGELGAGGVEASSE